MPPPAPALVVGAAVGLALVLSAGPAQARLPEPQPRAVPVAPVAPAAVPAGTGWPALDAAVARIPGYAATAPASWRVSSRYGHYGSTLLPAESVVVSPAVPPALLDAVVRHEWSHVLQSRAYGGDTPAMLGALDAAFGPGGADVAADCMALALGATWTHYTSCQDPGRQAAAAGLLAGLPVTPRRASPTALR